MIVYTSGYKYQLAEDYRIELPVTGRQIDTQWIALDADGWLTIRAGYAWDGPSGPAFDSACFMRASLVHDVIYQLIREDRLTPAAEFRELADDTMYAICLEDGMSRVRAWWCWRAVRGWAQGAARPSATRTLRYAP